MVVSKENGQEYTMYMNLYSPDINKVEQREKTDNSFYDSKSELPFAVIDKVGGDIHPQALAAKPGGVKNY